MLVEVQCETDFVARSDEFQEFAREVAIHIAGAPSPPLYVSAEEIPDEAREAERSGVRGQGPRGGQARRHRRRIVEGQLAKWAKEVALLEQEHVRADRYEGKTIEDLRAELASKTGENVRVARFARFVVGEDSALRLAAPCQRNPHSAASS